MSQKIRFVPYIIDGLSNDLKNLLKIFYLNIDLMPIKSYLSGSSVVKLYNRESILTFNDLDIYIQKDMNDKEISNLITNLTNGGYLLTKKKINNVNRKLHSAANDTNKKISNTHDYFSLCEHINAIISLENSENKKIDIIIMKHDIESLLIKTFDLDSVKNYIQIVRYNNIIKMINKESIDNFKATITTKHFTDRILNNIYEFNNFVKRYRKYSSRGYDIFIDNTILDTQLFMEIIKKIISTINIKYLRLTNEYKKYRVDSIIVNDDLDNLIQINLVGKNEKKIIYLSDLNQPDCFIITLFTMFKAEFRQNLEMTQGIINLVKSKSVNNLIKYNNQVVDDNINSNNIIIILVIGLIIISFKR